MNLWVRARCCGMSNVRADALFMYDPFSSWTRERHLPVLKTSVDRPEGTPLVKVQKTRSGFAVVCCLSDLILIGRSLIPFRNLPTFRFEQ